MLFFRILKGLFWGEKTLDSKTISKLKSHISALTHSSPREQIIQYDKIYHHTLKKLGYIGTFGEILKRNPGEIKNIQEIWKLHKLRNSLVHELTERDRKELEQQSKEYKRVLETFIKLRTK